MSRSNLQFDDVGSGRPVLFIHGFPLSRQMWQPQLRALKDAGFRGVAPDLPGFGASPVGEKAWTMDRFAEEMVALLDDLKLDKAVIAGMSMGGYILMNLLERFPDRAAAAVFVATRAAADDAQARQRRTELAGAAVTDHTEEVVEGFRNILFAPETFDRDPDLVAQVHNWMEQVDPRGLAGGLLAMRDRPDYVDRLPNFDLPALVVAGAEDQAVGREHFQQLCEALPQAQAALIPGGGHLVNLESPHPFNTRLLDFLNGLQLED